MRLLVENYGDAQIYKDYSLTGVPRWVVLWNDDRSQIFSTAWYRLEQVKQFVEGQL